MTDDGRSASALSVVITVNLLEFLETVLATDHADRAGASSHHDRFAGRALRGETNTLNQMPSVIPVAAK